MILIESHIVEVLEEQQRISDYLPGKLELITSKKGIQKALAKGLIKLDERVAKSADFVKGGETVELFKSQHPTKKKILNLKVPVIYEDEDIAIVDKPSGIAVSGNMHRVLENALPKNLKKSSKKDALDWPLPVHRLDFPTSGILLCVKSKSAQIALNKMFEERKIKKTYYAVCIGEFEPTGKIEHPIKGKKAVSEYELIDSVESTKYEQLNLVKLNPVTGRRHQLRIHMHHIGNPILGDKEYKIDGKVMYGKGLYLRATGIEFLHPISQKEINFQLDIPIKFTKIFDTKISE